MKKIAVVSSGVPSSRDVVISDDDILIEILLRLPIFSLGVFKTVSKRWLTLITNPNFILRRSQNPILDPPSGLYIQTSLTCNFVSLDIRTHSPTTFSLEFDSQKAEILQSCNGLILCRNMSRKLYVYNPSTTRFKTIPKPLLNTIRFSNLSGFRMAFDPSNSPHYKILYAHYRGSEVEIHIYSSETSNWSVCRDRSPFPCFPNGGFSNGIYWNGGICWLDGVNMVNLYLLDVEHPALISIQTPQKSSGVCHQKLFESGGCLLLLSKGPFDSPQFIYEMSKGCSSWSMKYTVDLDDIRVKYFKTCGWMRPEWCRESFRCIMIGKNEEDSFLVIGIYGEIMKYKMVSKTMCKICDLYSLDSSDSFEFIASFAGV